MKLGNIIKNCGTVTTKGDLTMEVNGLTSDSRKVVPGTMFIAVKGFAGDGHKFIASALAKGAAAIMYEDPQELEAQVNAARQKGIINADGAAFVQVENSRHAEAMAAADFYGSPSHELTLVGITGTNGKTTTVTLLYNLFRGLGYQCGLLSTIANYVGDKRLETANTTADPITINSLLRQMADEGCEYCFMEVSSIGMEQERVTGLKFKAGIFSNLTHDHLDYHKTFAEYLRCKKLFFDTLPADAYAITNIDDKNGMVMVQNTKASVRTYGLRTMADFRCRVVEMLLDGMQLDLDGREVWVKFLGRFNAYNLTAVYATALLLGADRDEVLRTLSGLGPVDGRFESIRSHDGVTAIVDYAHTPDALQNVIDTIDEIRGKDRKLYVVVGCGGNRDRTKRPEMARIAADGADLAVLTSDNPRKEDPEAILAEMKAGLDASSRYLCIADRREAIKAAVALARPGDIVLVAGKGHETYQDVGGVKHHFDDREEVRRAMGLE